MEIQTINKMCERKYNLKSFPTISDMYLQIFHTPCLYCWLPAA